MTMITPTTLDSLKSCMEINNGGLFFSLLKDPENQHFYAAKVKNVKNAYFTPEIDTIRWNDDVIRNSATNSQGFPFDEIIIDVSLSGTLSEYNNRGITFSSQPVEFHFTIQAFVFQGQFSVSRENIKLLNAEQKVTLLFHKNYEQEIDRLGIKLLFEETYQGDEAFTFFTRIWKLVDRTNPTQVTDSSHDYFDEFVECHRNILYSVAMSNIWGRYITTYGSNYYYFQGNKVFPVNLDYNDNRFIFYLENAIEEIYTFYERLAYLFYLFMQPTGLSGAALSFNKLFERKTKKELKQKFPQLANDANYQWFEKRFSKEHKTLSGYRHPLIHYQTSNTFIKGSYNSSVKRIWLANAGGNEQALQQLANDIRAIQRFVNNELAKCRDAFEKAILIVENLPPLGQPPVI
ncbi:hypothetical protein Mucpa_2362 [Mucilaginibacter paludis DSM 18603]|uniref:Cthe-2314-like HEPN domain-containing protein n=2 Tax=Mucilaginibacter TaxID=423349 RepID=H1YI57_9SPHI|nr:hypothetical protein Mucpa_2362 [Mucilaginibacter paludis DSM 18603]